MTQVQTACATLLFVVRALVAILDSARMSDGTQSSSAVSGTGSSGFFCVARRIVAVGDLR